MTTPTTQPTPPPVNPLNIAKKVQIGQLLEISDGNLAGAKLRVTETGAYEAVMGAYGEDPETTVTIIAECRHCAFTAEVDADDGDHSGIEFRVWRHERDFPGHVIGYRTDTVRWWD